MEGSMPRRDREEYLNEEDIYDSKNMYLPVDTFIRRSLGKEYSPFDEDEENEMVIPLE